ncbi:hypothetical protein DENSPDRAFT_758500, partial [Dentipellis sp. KUC8613]
MFGVGMGPAGGLKGLNSGWQVWGNGTQSSKRNPSISSAASVAELASAQGDSSFRTNLSEGWNSGRPPSGAWEDVNGSPQKKELLQLVSTLCHSEIAPAHLSSSLSPAQDSLALHHARQRQPASASFATPRMDDRSPGVGKTGQFSPQRFDNSLNKDPAPSQRYAPAASPQPSGFGSSSSPFANQQVLQNTNMGYDTMQTSNVVENELAMGLRGMAVEDDSYGVPQQGSPYRQQGSGNQQSAGGAGGHPSVPQIRGPPMPQPRGPYNAYPQTDYGTYYTGPPSRRDNYVDYSYPYDAYRATPDPTLYPSSSVSASTSPANAYPSVSTRRASPTQYADQPGVFYDYTGPARPPGSQFYYAAQPMVYPGPPSHSPMLTPQLASAVPASL